MRNDNLYYNSHDQRELHDQMKLLFGGSDIDSDSNNMRGYTLNSPNNGHQSKLIHWTYRLVPSYG